MFWTRIRQTDKARHNASYERTAYGGVMPIIGVQHQIGSSAGPR
jgi:hypothetical protein